MSTALALGAEQAMRIGAFEFQPTGLVVHGQPDFDQWAQIGEYIRLVHCGVQWWWGDWLN